jgi:uncharacterized protein (DUF983 family)
MQKSVRPAETQQFGGKSEDERPIFGSLLKGARLKCPACGKGAMFHRYLKVADSCPACGEELHHHRADDAPAYFTIVIVGHIVVSLVLAVEMAYRPELWVHMALWLPFTVVMTLLLLPPIKGALVALQWALRMHGFDPDSKDEVESFSGDLVSQPPRRLDFRS